MFLCRTGKNTGSNLGPEIRLSRRMYFFLFYSVLPGVLQESTLNNGIDNYVPAVRNSLLSSHFTFDRVIQVSAHNTRSVRKVSSHFEYLENRLRGLDVTWQPVRGDLTVHP